MSTLNEKYPWLCSTMNRADYCPPSNVSLGDGNFTDLVDDLTTGMQNMSSFKWTYYVMSKDVIRDKILGEDQLQYIERAFYMTGYMEQMPTMVKSYQMQGIWNQDILQVFVPKTFQYFSTYGTSTRNVPETYDFLKEPRIGDLMYLEKNGIFYEIIDVKYYTEAFNLKSHSYTLTLRVWKDTKATILDNDTIPKDDPIFAVTTYPLESDKNFDDPLKLNDNFRRLSTSGNVNEFDYVSRKVKGNNI
ncbi:MAG: hypothetical protein MJZ34_10590 [Paludibacteraceae bacterium]|nr:hypothetical protein [Paludibacteraceae bacterium]